MTIPAGRLGYPPHCHSAEEEIFVVLARRGHAPARRRGARRSARQRRRPPAGDAGRALLPRRRGRPRLPRVRDEGAERHRLLPPLGQGQPARRRRHGADRAPGLLGRRAVATAATGFAGEDTGPPRARRRADPEAPVETLAGVGPKVAERLARLGLRTVRDLAEHVPRAYLDWEQVASFGDLSAGEEATVRCTLERVRVRPTRRRNLKIVEGVVVDAAGVRETAIWFNQAYLAKLDAGHRAAPARDARARRRLPGRPHRGARNRPAHGRPRPRVPRERGGALATGCAPTSRRRCPRVRFFPDPLPARVRHEEGLPLRADALVAAHRPRDRGEAEGARERLAFEELLALQLGFQERRRALEEEAERARAPGRGRADRPLPRRAALHAHAGAGARDRRDRRRSRRHEADAAAPAGRRRLREDRRGALRAPARGRGRPSGRADGADGDARRAALPHGRGDLQRARRALRAPHELRPRRPAPGGARPPGERRDRPRRRHARAHPGGGRVPLPRGRRRRRAAPLRGRAAARARQDDAARPAHDGDADPAHAGPDRLRRPRRHRDRQAAREPQARDHALGRPRAQRRGVHAPAPAPGGGSAGLRRLPARLRVRDDRGARGRAGGRAAANGTSCAGSGSASSTGS